MLIMTWQLKGGNLTFMKKIVVALLPTLLIQTMFVGSLAHAQNDIIYVSDPGAGTVSEIDSATGNESTFAFGLDNPEGLALDSYGNLYVANSGNGTVSQINSAGNVSTYASGFINPMGVACDPYGNVYVSDLGNGTISKINSSENVSAFTSVPINTYYSLGFLTSDNAGNIYAATGSGQNYNGLSTVIELDSNGNPIAYPGGSPAAISGIAVYGAGNVYYGVVDGPAFLTGNGGLLVNSWDYPAPYNLGGPVEDYPDPPGGLAFDADGNLFVAFGSLTDNNNDTVSDALVEFGANGVNTLIATDIGGTDIAVQTVPEPGILTLVSGLVAVLCIRRRSSSQRA
jgi:glucose/arabinose dehydrogenase